MWFNGEITTGAIAIIISNAVLIATVFIKLRDNVIDLAAKYVELKGDVLEMKADLKVMTGNQQDIKVELAKISAITSVSQTPTVPPQLARALERVLGQDHHK